MNDPFITFLEKVAARRKMNIYCTKEIIKLFQVLKNNLKMIIKNMDMYHDNRGNDT